MVADYCFVQVAFASPRAELVAVCDHAEGSQTWAQENLPAGIEWVFVSQSFFRAPLLTLTNVSGFTRRLRNAFNILDLMQS